MIISITNLIEYFAPPSAFSTDYLLDNISGFYLNLRILFAKGSTVSSTLHSIHFAVCGYIDIQWDKVLWKISVYFPLIQC